MEKGVDFFLQKRKEGDLVKIKIAIDYFILEKKDKEYMHSLAVSLF